MPRHDLKKLRSRLHWIEDYAIGLSAAQIMSKYQSEGATERKFRTARVAALDMGLLKPDEDLVGSGFTIDEKIMNRIRSPEINESKKLDQIASHGDKAAIIYDIFQADEVKALKEIVVKWKKRDLEFTKGKAGSRDLAHWIKLNKPLFEMCKIYAKKSNISLDQLVTLALMDYLRINPIATEPSPS